MDERPKRPTGISILAVLCLLGSTGLLLMLVFLRGQLMSSMGELGLSLPMVAAGFALVGGAGLGAGIGMWTGKPWGWWLGAFCFCYSIALSVNALIGLPVIQAEFGASDEEVRRYYFRYGARIAVNLLLIAYFFKPHVVAYFGVGRVRARDRLVFLAGATAAVVVAFRTLGGLVSGQ